MSVYFDRYIDDQQLGVLKVGLEWHRVAPLVAVSWYSEQHGGGVSIYNDEVSGMEDAQCYFDYVQWFVMVVILQVGKIRFGIGDCDVDIVLSFIGDGGGWMAEWLARWSFNPRSCGLAGSNPGRRSVARPSLPPGLR